MNGVGNRQYGGKRMGDMGWMVDMDEDGRPGWRVRDLMYILRRGVGAKRV